MGDIQNGQWPKQEADTDLEKDIVPPTHFDQQIESEEESSPDPEAEQPTSDSTLTVETNPDTQLESVSQAERNDSKNNKLPLVVPEILRTLVFAHPCGDDQFASCRRSHGVGWRVSRQ